MFVRRTSARQRFFLAGESIRASGIYRASHNSHRGSHEVTLLRDEAFPPCEVCGDDVRFERVRTLNDTCDIRIRLYKLPHVIGETPARAASGPREMAVIERERAKKAREESQRLRREAEFVWEKAEQWFQHTS